MITGGIIRAVHTDGSLLMSERSIAEARARLLAHYDAHKRAMPWRETKDPYAIWVSEVMLQQTRVETVIPYFQRFLSRFDGVRALAEAPEADVLALWSGLGYYRRARMLHAGAKHVLREHAGALPADIAALKKIPGVGDYTAGAIASIAFDLREPVLDGNVERVLSRLAAMPGDPRAKTQRTSLWSLARAFAQDPRAGDVNQALMELGATVCTPASPRCLLCPVRAQCAASAAAEPERYPEKPPKRAPRAERWTALVVRDERGAFWLGPPPAHLDRWKGMLVPPLALDGAAVEGLRDGAVIAEVVHVLTHARMQITVRAASFIDDAAPSREGSFVALDSLGALAIPKVTRVILDAVAQAGAESTAVASSRKKASIRPRKGRAKKGSSPPSRT
jgi:A/G-specific adenine glycosylase